MLLDPLIRNGLKAAEKHAPSVWPPVEFDGDVLITFIPSIVQFSLL